MIAVGVDRDGKLGDRLDAVLCYRLRSFDKGDGDCRFLRLKRLVAVSIRAWGANVAVQESVDVPVIFDQLLAEIDDTRVGMRTCSRRPPFPAPKGRANSAGALVGR